MGSAAYIAGLSGTMTMAHYREIKRKLGELGVSEVLMLRHGKIKSLAI